jgi:dCTP deaminase
VLGRGAIVRAMQHEDLERQLVITPLLSDSQIGEVSVDLRLGTEFVTTRRANIPAFEPLRKDQAEVQTRKWQESLLVPRGKTLVLHPGELILGASLEYVRLPPNLGAYVTSRSSWGRLGLVIATATAVAPGYRGIITLELTNVGNAPLVLSPGVRIAQMLFHELGEDATYRGRYKCPTVPEMGKIHADEELSFWLAERSLGH